jgi:hypothetical protein
MDFALSDDQPMFVETVRTFVDKEPMPHEAQVERTDKGRRAPSPRLRCL